MKSYCKGLLLEGDRKSIEPMAARLAPYHHSTLLMVTILIVTISGIGGGLVLSVSGNSAFGNPVLEASFTLLSGLAGKLLGSRDKD